MSSNSLQQMSEPHTPPVTIVLAVLLLFFFCVGFFAIFFCRCFLDNLIHIWYRWQGHEGTPVGLVGPAGGQGLDPSIKNSFPAFPYSTVKDLRREKYGLECAICLLEFAGDDMLRLLPACYHVFHQECIDLWLESHKTCPVCRRRVDSEEKCPEKSPAPTMVEINENEPMDDAVSITVDNDGDIGGEAVLTSAASSIDQKQDTLNDREDKIYRSHSTGHSIGRTRSKEDKFTLKLQEDLHVKIARGHHWSESCTTFGELKSREPKGNGGFGEV